MFTAADAREMTANELDDRIKESVSKAASNGKRSVSIRFYAEDSFWCNREQELLKRGFELPYGINRDANWTDDVEITW